MSNLKIIIEREYLNDITSRSFWLSTILFPILTIGFGVFVGFIAGDSESMREISSMGAPDNPEDLSGMQVLGMLLGMFLTIFLMVYGTQIFNKVKTEKANRIMEIIATSTSGRTMMLGKVVAVALIGLTQLVVWFILILGGVAVLMAFFNLGGIMGILTDMRLWLALLYSVLFFVGGYLMYGSFYAMVGAMTDRDNENQGYIVIITFLLMASFYIAQFALDNPDAPLAVWSSYIPFTSPSIGAVGAITGALYWWQTILSLLILYASAWVAVSIAGKIYTSAMLLNGKKFTPKDLFTFLKAK